MIYRIIFILLLTVQFGYSQNFYVIGSTVHIGNGEVIEQAVIIVEEGKIANVVEAVLVKLDINFGPILNMNGKHIYPGIIAPDTRIGLVEIDNLRPTEDFIEVGKFNPNIRSLIAYNTDSDVAETILSNGILFAQIVPKGGFISGSSSVVKLDAWNWEDAAVKADDGIHLWWPGRFQQGGWWGNPGKITENGRYQTAIDAIRAFLFEAKAYYEAEPNDLEINLKFEALKEVFNGNQNLYVHANEAKEMISAIYLTEALGINTMVIVGGNHAMEISELLKEKNIPVILGSIHELPTRNQSDINELYKLPGQLQQEGIKFCLSYKNAWEQRSLLFLAGSAAAYGLSKEEALASITKNAAEILRLQNIGTLEAGKDATFIISKGDVLDMRTSIIEQAYIKGKAVDLNNKQKELYDKYKSKYKSEGKL